MNLPVNAMNSNDFIVYFSVVNENIFFIIKKLDAYNWLNSFSEKRKGQRYGH